MSPLTLTFWRGGAQVPSGGEIRRVAWDRCAERVRAPGAALESRDKLAHPMWAFATYRDGYRTKANLVEVTAIVVDLDCNPEAPDGSPARGSPELTLAELQRALVGLRFAAHTTWSHAAGAARWRLVIPLDRPCTATEFAPVARSIAARLRAAGIAGVDADPTWMEPSRAYVVPLRRAGLPYEGYATALAVPALDVDAALAAAFHSPPVPIAPPETKRAKQSPGVDERAARYGAAALARALDAVRGAPLGQRNATLFREGAGIGQLVAGRACGLLSANVEAALVSAAEAAGVPHGEAVDTARRAVLAGHETPRTPPADPPGPIGPSPDRAAHTGERGCPPAESVVSRWPTPLGAAALIGPAGKFVELVGPHTEADPAALLIQFLVAAGAWIGRAPYVQVGGDRHHTNLYAALVGKTAGGRKGTSWGEVRRVFRLIDPEWAATNISGGLSSGEGVIHAVRDAVEQAERTRGGATRAESSGDDRGIADKRLLVVETEFASVLTRMLRDGNTLSSVMRQGWDSGALSVMTKTPYRATGAHIAIVTHITQDELLRMLSATEMANGFANRFLWVCAARSQLLPEGGSLEEGELAGLVLILQRAGSRARTRSAMGRTAAASGLWRDEYARLTRERPGMFGALVGRGAPVVLRLALVYALLDEASAIDRHHMAAALEVWRYCEASVRFVFGDSLGDPTADVLLNALRRAGDAGLSRTEIRDRLGRNAREADVDRALGKLAEHGLATLHREATGGRPAERWRASTTETTKG